MTKRGMDFLELWMERHLAGTGDAAWLARGCAADALTGGIIMEEIEEDRSKPSSPRHLFM